MADSTTAKAESSQAYLMYIADMLGKVETEKIFNCYINAQWMSPSLKEAEAAGSRINSAKKNAIKVADFFFNSAVRKLLFTKSHQSHKPALNIVDSNEYNSAITNFYNNNQRPLASDRVKTTVGLMDCIEFLQKNKDWFISSLKIAQKFISNVDTISRNFRGIKELAWQDLYYKRGDAAVMGKIQTIFSVVNKNQGNVFGDINKWSTADMYVASKTAKDKINELDRKKEKLNFVNLNLAITNLIKSGDIIPISLKQVKTGEVTLLKVNFKPDEEKQYIDCLEFAGFQESKTLNFKNLRYDNIIKTKLEEELKKKAKPTEMIALRNALNGARREVFQGSALSDEESSGEGGRDVIMIVNGGLKKDKDPCKREELGQFQFRHLPHSISETFEGRNSGTGLKFTFKYKNSGAQDGQIASLTVLKTVMGRWNGDGEKSKKEAQKFANNLKTTWDDNIKKYQKTFRIFMRNLYNLLVKQEFSGFTKKHTAYTLPVWPDDYKKKSPDPIALKKELRWWAGALSAVCLMNIVKEKCFKLDKTWWKSPNCDTIIRAAFVYATARTNLDGKIKSSRYVLFKD